MSTGKICPTCGTEYPMSERFCPRDGTALRAQDANADIVGTVIAERYHVMRKLGEGGMGAVYLAEHVKMGRKSAIKVMNPGMSRDPDAIARFNREASNASRMNHPNICAIYDFGETPDGLIYLAMEFIEGRSLTDLIRESGSLAPARAAGILQQTADALQVAHDHGIVHRDLKPDNIMIAKGRDNSDLVKVVDFGIAKAHTGEAQKVTKTGLVVGTPEYMSPEQLAGDKLDGRSDIYSLALVGFNMLTGTLPFPAQTAQETMIMRLTDEPKTLAEMKPDVAWPETLQAVLSKALARDVADRYAKATDFGRDFSIAVDAMPATKIAEAGTVVLKAKTPIASDAIPKTRVGGDREPTQRTTERAPVVAQRSSMPMVAAGVAIVAALGIGGYAVMSNRSDTGTDSTTMNPGLTGASGQTGAPGSGNDGGAPANTGKVATNGGAGGGGGGGDVTPPVQPETSRVDQAAAQLRRDLDRLDSLVIHAPTVTEALNLADRLLPLTQGEDRVEVLLRRGSAYRASGDDTRGCADLREALRRVAPTSVFERAIRNTMAGCD